MEKYFATWYRFDSRTATTTIEFASITPIGKEVYISSQLMYNYIWGEWRLKVIVEWV
jgi:hypothetical protein